MVARDYNLMLELKSSQTFEEVNKVCSLSIPGEISSMNKYISLNLILNKLVHLVG